MYSMIQFITWFTRDHNNNIKNICSPIKRRIAALKIEKAYLLYKSNCRIRELEKFRIEYMVACIVETPYKT